MKKDASSAKKVWGLRREDKLLVNLENAKTLNRKSISAPNVRIWNLPSLIIYGIGDLDLA
jgi:hypothetical protein